MRRREGAGNISKTWMKLIAPFSAEGKPDLSSHTVFSVLYEEIRQYFTSKLHLQSQEGKSNSKNRRIYIFRHNKMFITCVAKSCVRYSVTLNVESCLYLLLNNNYNYSFRTFHHMYTNIPRCRSCSQIYDAK